MPRLKDNSEVRLFNAYRRLDISTDLTHRGRDNRVAALGAHHELFWYHSENTSSLICSITIALFAVIDMTISNSSLRFKLIPDSFRIPDRRTTSYSRQRTYPPVSRSGAIATIASILTPWDSKTTVGREIEPVSERPVRVLFIGDSFTEGVGLPWNQTFVGLFAALFPDVEVLNGGVVGYSPSIYLRQVELLLGRGVTLNKVIIFIDISDVQDEALCRFDASGNVVDAGYVVNPLARVGDAPDTIQRYSRIALPDKALLHSSLWSEFQLTRYLDRQTALLLSASRQASDPDRLVKSMWTVAGVDLPYGYGSLGVIGGNRRRSFA